MNALAIVLGVVAYLSVGVALARLVRWWYLDDPVIAGLVALAWPLAIVSAAAAGLLFGVGWLVTYPKGR